MYLKKDFENIFVTEKVAEKSKPSAHAIKIHGCNLMQNWKFEILASSSDEMDRKIKEAELIKRNNPSLNRKHGLFFVDI